MIFIEPTHVYNARQGSPKPIVSSLGTVYSAQETPAAAPFKEEFWSGIIFNILELEAGPMVISSLVSAAAKWGDYGCRSDREQRKIELFVLIRRLINTGRLCRFARKYVRIATPDELKAHQECLAKQLGTLNLPTPNLGGGKAHACRECK